MGFGEDQLEQALLTLGRQELDLEIRIRRLQERAREAGRNGRFDEADRAWGLLERTRRSLSALQSDITNVERKLYGLRRRR